MEGIVVKKEVRRTVICLMVDNQPNVLARVSSLIGRRSFNISTVTASETNIAGITKITLAVSGDDENVLYQIITQLGKLEPVREVYVLASDSSVYRELLLVKVKADKRERTELHEITEIYRGKVIGLNKETAILPYAGETLYVYLPGEYMGEEIIPAFEEATGATVVVENFESNEQM